MVEKEPGSAFEKSLSRRGFVNWMGRMGLAVVGGMASIVALQTPAEAACGKMQCGATSANWRCCSLNLPNNFCPIDSSGNPASCDNGYLYVWNCCCCGGSRTYACAECIKYQAGTCCVGWQDTICSGGWTTSTTGCFASSTPPPGNCP